ncbi:MAG: DUF2290 domain-containing protein [Candidatus Sumerlaeota bacterium]|nr:DUF2290 domain-containing protein [Candidatus Sumerlaeota bacterium]
MIGAGEFKSQLNDVEHILKTINMLDSRQRFPQKCPGRAELKKMSYRQIYERLVSDNVYDFKLSDNSLLIFENEDGNELRYCYYECPQRLMSYEDFVLSSLGIELNDPNIEQILNEIGDSSRNEYEQYVETEELKTAVTPIRYDYAPGDYREGVHPASHIHCGFESQIRIATVKIMNPISFLLMIMRQCYPLAWEKKLLCHSKKAVWCKNVRDHITPIHKKYFRALDKMEIFLQ